MAAGTIVSVIPAAWDPRIDLLSPRQAIKIALEGAAAVPLAIGASDAATDANRLANNQLADTLAARMAGDADMVLTGTTALAADTLTLDLTARGVTFPAGSMRVIDCEMFYQGNTVATESGYIHFREMVVGGTTPTLGIVIGAIDTNMAGAVAAFTTNDPTLALVMSGNSVTVVVTGENAAEPGAVVLKVRVGKLQQINTPTS
jgi:hypothetical protein